MNGVSKGPLGRALPVGRRVSLPLPLLPTLFLRIPRLRDRPLRLIENMNSFPLLEEMESLLLAGHIIKALLYNGGIL